MDNASSMITDARILLEHGSPGRARSLTVLAQEELGKALWIYEMFEDSWSTGDEAFQVVEKLTEHGRNHVSKYMEAFVFGQELAVFWGDYDAMQYPENNSQEAWEAFFSQKKSEARVASQRANQEKMQGFYVDLSSDRTTILSPNDVPPGHIADDLQIAAQVVEMLLIRDHTRMQQHPDAPFDATYEQQSRLLPISHPEEWNAAPERFKQYVANRKSKD